MTKHNFDAVLCDIDGVLRFWPPTDPIEMKHGLPSGAIHDAAFGNEYHISAITGRITDEQWRAYVSAELVRKFGNENQITAAITAWSATMPHIDQEAISVLKQIRELVPVVLVSNA